ncbi:GTPase HflX [Secundilactobacillus mixtipabuli]|uniref:GTPase HflX n=1 Tax=Secundilactobacillus mixtipabuli TaxID=1435342 RepID=A0A1Z5IB52_9LACO|nr:GTPase HflX [Secundilactobacillus mixtipabuli]GAW98848.1 GTP-binding protein [Secundilactobacillus mixtipabuli]
MDNSELVPVINIGLNTGRYNFDYAMEELKALSEANNMNVVETTVQNLSQPVSGTYFGTGKVEELRDIVVDNGAEIVVANDELTPSQIRNLEKVVKVPVMDRTGLILAIFANRAQSREAKLQVQLAKLQYQMPRLHTAMNQRLDQQTGTSAGGGFTNRGAGEAQIELNRRTVQRQINHVRHELKDVDKSAEVKRQQREKIQLPNVALIGYTNAGKSTIMNELIKRYGMNDDKQVMVKNMLFATLDTSVRQLQFDDSKKLLLSDTVGFVSQLPTTLVEAFKSTLYEAANADLLVQVVDYSSPNRIDMMATTKKTLADIGVPDLPMITVYNKADLTDNDFPSRAGDEIVVSAKDTASIDLLVQVIREKVFKNYVTATFLIPFEKGDVVSYLNEHASVKSTDYLENGTKIEAEVTNVDYQRFEKYVLEQ